MAALVVVLIAAGSSLQSWNAYSSGGVLDQQLTGDPGCPYKGGSVGTVGGLRQEFVPSLSVLNAVEVCVQTRSEERRVGKECAD